jgi:hypothetical protein
MSLCIRASRLFFCLALSAVLWAQSARAQDYDHQQDSSRRCVRKHPRISPIDYLLVPGFPGGRISLPIATVANAVTALAFHLDRDFRVSHVGMAITLPEAGSFAYAGIYDEHGNLLVQGKFSTDVAGNITIDVTRVWLKPGMYYFAIGAESTTPQALGYLYDDGLITLTQSGVAANQIADGALPATLGTITPPLLGSTPSAVFRP